MQYPTPHDRLPPVIYAALLAFFATGFAYLLLPDQHYRTDGLAALAKYVALVPLGVAALYFYLRREVSLPALFLFLAWSIAMSLSLWAGTPPARVAVYWIPSLAIFLPSVAWREMPRLSALVIALGAVAAVYEYLVLGGFSRFAVSGYRATAIFINPNNMAITVVILLALASQRYRGAALLALGAVTAALVTISQSKTGMALFGLLVVYLAWRWQPRLAVYAAAAVVAVTVAALALDLVRAPWLSLYLRVLQSLNFITHADDFLFPGMGGVQHVDNVYLFTWAEAGLPAALVFVVALAFAYWYDKLRSPIWMLFGAAGVTTNFIFLWPLAYIFWAYVGNTRMTRGPDLVAIFHAVRRRWPVIVGLPLLFAAAQVVWMLTAPPAFVATATLSTGHPDVTARDVQRAVGEEVQVQVLNLTTIHLTLVDGSENDARDRIDAAVETLETTAFVVGRARMAEEYVAERTGEAIDILRGSGASEAERATALLELDAVELSRRLDLRLADTGQVAIEVRPKRPFGRSTLGAALAGLFLALLIVGILMHKDETPRETADV